MGEVSMALEDFLGEYFDLVEVKGDKITLSSKSFYKVIKRCANVINEKRHETFDREVERIKEQNRVSGKKAESMQKEMHYIKLEIRRLRSLRGVPITEFEKSVVLAKFKSDGKLRRTIDELSRELQKRGSIIENIQKHLASLMSNKNKFEGIEGLFDKLDNMKVLCDLISPLSSFLN